MHVGQRAVVSRAAWSEPDAWRRILSAGDRQVPGSHSRGAVNLEELSADHGQL